MSLSGVFVDCGLRIWPYDLYFIFGPPLRENLSSGFPTKRDSNQSP